MIAKRLYNTAGEWIGISRLVTEFWEVGSDQWFFQPLDFDPEKSEILNRLPKGIAGLPRKRIRIKGELNYD